MYKQEKKFYNQFNKLASKEYEEYIYWIDENRPYDHGNIWPNITDEELYEILINSKNFELFQRAINMIQENKAWENYWDNH